MVMVTYSEFSDQELIRLLKLADHAAFNEIYNRYSPKVYYQVNQMLRDEDAAKDIIQELFVKIWDRAFNIKSDAQLGGYLYIAARNLVFKYIEKGTLQNDYIASLSAFSKELNETELKEFDERDLYIAIDLEIAKLPEKMRQVFELSRKENLSYHQISVQLGISEHTVRNQISNAMKILRSNLNNQVPAGFIVLALLQR